MVTLLPPQKPECLNINQKSWLDVFTPTAFLDVPHSFLHLEACYPEMSYILVERYQRFGGVFYPCTWHYIPDDNILKFSISSELLVLIRG
jgi:hypothetical protein